MTTQSPEDRIAHLEAELKALKARNTELEAAQTASPRRKPVAWRSVFSVSLLIVGLVALVPAGMLVWLNRTVVSPEAYIASVGPIIQQPAVQKAVQQKATDELFARVDVGKIVGEALPEKAQFLAEPIAGQVKTYASTAIGRIVASPQFAQVWVEANVKAQAAFMNIAENSNGSPEVDLSRLYSFISAQLESTPLAGLADKQLPPKIGSIQVATVPALERIPAAVAMLDAWRWWMVALAVGLMGLAIGLAKNRRRSLIWAGVGIILAGFVTLVIIRVTRAVMLDPIADPVYREAAVAVWQTILTPFLAQLGVTAAVGLTAVVAGWLAGPGRVATTIRTGTLNNLASARTSLLPNAGELGAVKFAVRYHVWFLWGIALGAVAALLLSIPLSYLSLTIIIMVAVLFLLLLEFVVAPDLRSRSEAKKPTTPQAQS